MAYNEGHDRAVGGASAKDVSYSGGASIAPGKRTLTQSLASPARGETVEGRLERFERQLDLVEDLGPVFLSRLASPDAPTFAGMLQVQLDELRALRDAMRVSRTTAKRKGLARPLAAALKRADRMLDTYQPIVDSIRQSTPAAHEAASNTSDGEIATDEGGYETGIPFVDEGPLCARDPKPDAATFDCPLTDEQRERLGAALERGVTSSMANYHAAISRARLQALASTKSGWGFLEEVLFYAVSGGLIGRVVVGMKNLRNLSNPRLKLGLPASVDPELIRRMTTEKAEAGVVDALTVSSKGIRAELKAAADKSGMAHSRDEFLKVIERNIKRLGDSIVLEAPLHLDDVSLGALALSYLDAEAHSPDAYEEKVNGLADRYSAQGIDDAGSVQPLHPMKVSDAYRTVVRLRAFGKERLAMLAQPVTTNVQQDGTKSEEITSSIFQNWIDDEFRHLAEGIQVERRGVHGAVRTIDISSGEPPFIVDELSLTKETPAQWIERARDERNQPDAAPTFSGDEELHAER